MKNKTTKGDMPVNIWTVKDQFDIVKIVPESFVVTPTKYTNTEYLKKMIDGMKKDGSIGYPSCKNKRIGIRNKALEDVLKLLEDNND